MKPPGSSPMNVSTLAERTRPPAQGWSRAARSPSRAARRAPRPGRRQRVDDREMGRAGHRDEPAAGLPRRRTTRPPRSARSRPTRRGPAPSGPRVRAAGPGRDPRGSMRPRPGNRRPRRCRGPSSLGQPQVGHRRQGQRTGLLGAGAAIAAHSARCPPAECPTVITRPSCPPSSPGTTASASATSRTVASGSPGSRRYSTDTDRPARVADRGGHRASVGTVILRPPESAVHDHDQRPDPARASPHQASATCSGRGP